MLVLTIEQGESLYIDDIEIRVVKTKKGDDPANASAKLGIEAPQEADIVRSELNQEND